MRESSLSGQRQRRRNRLGRRLRGARNELESPQHGVVCDVLRYRWVLSNHPVPIYAAWVGVTVGLRVEFRAGLSYGLGSDLEPSVCHELGQCVLAQDLGQSWWLGVFIYGGLVFGVRMRG